MGKLTADEIAEIKQTSIDGRGSHLPDAALDAVIAGIEAHDHTDATAGTGSGAPIPHAALADQKIVVKTTDLELVHVLALIPDPQLQFDIGANESWHFSVRLLGDPTGAGEAVGIDVGLVAPEGAEVNWQWEDNYNTAYDVNGVQINALIGAEVNEDDHRSGLSVAMLAGFVTAGETPGVVGLTFKQHSNFACHCSVKATSFLRATRLA